MQKRLRVKMYTVSISKIHDLLYSVYAFRALMMLTNFGLRDAPPTRNPSTTTVLEAMVKEEKKVTGNSMLKKFPQLLKGTHASTKQCILPSQKELQLYKIPCRIILKPMRTTPMGIVKIGCLPQIPITVEELCAKRRFHD